MTSLHTSAIARTRQSSTPSPDPGPHSDAGGYRVQLSNEETRPRTVAVVVRGSDHRASVERVTIPPDDVVRLVLPVVDGDLTVGCHSDDGRSGVCTYRPGGSGSLAFTLRNGSMLLDGG